jgi:hypothetical protein
VRGGERAAFWFSGSLGAVSASSGPGAGRQRHPGGNVKIRWANRSPLRDSARSDALSARRVGVESEANVVGNSTGNRMSPGAVRRPRAGVLAAYKFGTVIRLYEALTLRANVRGRTSID